MVTISARDPGRDDNGLNNTLTLRCLSPPAMDLAVENLLFSQHARPVAGAALAILPEQGREPERLGQTWRRRAGKPRDSVRPGGGGQGAENLLFSQHARPVAGAALAILPEQGREAERLGQTWRRRTGKPRDSVRPRGGGQGGENLLFSQHARPVAGAALAILPDQGREAEILGQTWRRRSRGRELVIPPACSALGWGGSSHST
ncbi:hypothetical protein RRG08_057900 [Elysia crispata]|uniref:Uncharacterized protein n=1 Tax=Elysia crispata TaxID=231223 RepID=A0AAE0ZR91_9GAST|nr:hypothetical protein RRG08_057900 [Elysia crispata]